MTGKDTDKEVGDGSEDGMVTGSGEGKRGDAIDLEHKEREGGGGGGIGKEDGSPDGSEGPNQGSDGADGRREEYRPVQAVGSRGAGSTSRVMGILYAARAFGLDIICRLTG